MGTDGLKVLVVDDEARMRKLVRDFLTVKAAVQPASLLYGKYSCVSEYYSGSGSEL